MNTSRRFFHSCVVALCLSAMPLPGQTEEPLPVVATFSILGDMVKRVGGDEVSITTLVGRSGDTHVYQPTPADAKAVKGASVLFTNGLQFEGWLERLVEAAGFAGTTVVATDGMELLAMDDDHHGDEHDDNHSDHDEHGSTHDEDHEDHHEDHHDENHAKAHSKEHDEAQHDDHGHDADHKDEHAHEVAEHDHHHHGEFDPHGWLSLKNAVVYVDNITAALAKAVPEKSALFYQNRAAYVAEIQSLDTEIKDMIAALPDSARTVITSHDAFQYFGHEYGLTFMAAQGLSTESEASAKEVAELIVQIREEGIAAVFVENVADSRLLEQIARETNSVIGGTLYSGSLSAVDGPASTYLDLMHHNASTIAAALGDAR